MEIHQAAQSIREGLNRAVHGLVDRETLAELLILGAVAGENLLVIGPPGTGKSEAIRRVSHLMGGRYFEYLLGRFTEPSEIFGPIDLQKLQGGRLETDTNGMLPEADFVFLDEVFLGSTAILNTLLSILNERKFRRGHTECDCPLKICVGASNQLPHEEHLAAFSDRFLIHHFVEGIADPQLETLLEGGWSLRRKPQPQPELLACLDQLRNRVNAVDMNPVRPHLGEAIRTLRNAGLGLSDRRMVKSQSLIAAACLLDGRTQADTRDLWPIIFVLPDADHQEQAREILKEVLTKTESLGLPSAAEEASLGKAAKLSRWFASAQALQQEPPSEADLRPWIAKMEGLLREVDASFEVQELKEDQTAIRLWMIDQVESWRSRG
ncbi:MAG: AAA family ATPase [Acidobacteria bacterium]|nr:AAA family ATPase [Acidobacteriota bacterium]